MAGSREAHPLKGFPLCLILIQTTNGFKVARKKVTPCVE